MLERLKYQNHQNEVFDFGKDGIYVNSNNLHDYEWKATTRGNRIGALTRQISTRKLPIIIMCKTEEEGIRARNRLLEVVEKDVLAMKHGKIIIGNYYFRCFVTKSVKDNYLTNRRHMTVNLTLTSDYPYWVKESTVPFRNDEGTGQGIGLDFPYDFSYDYYSVLMNTTLFNSGFVPSNFKLIVYGLANDPTISIGGHTYQVNCDVEEGEYLTIDSTTKKIFLTKNDGTIVNQFNNRNKESYIFEKIPVGGSAVTWSGSFGFDLILMEERSEPKWI